MRNCDPVYEQGYTFLVNNPENDSLSIIVSEFFLTNTFLFSKIYKFERKRSIILISNNANNKL